MTFHLFYYLTICVAEGKEVQGLIQGLTQGLIQGPPASPDP